jgi:hypothetical protein|tara:strand:- start:136 stop:348 length:213 start_codon:yes stop_codon:yes gene_type:complete
MNVFQELRTEYRKKRAKTPREALYITMNLHRDTDAMLKRIAEHYEISKTKALKVIVEKTYRDFVNGGKEL